jgi:hypothetical protein
LTLIAEGDEQAFNTIFSRYRDRLFQFLIRIVKSANTVRNSMVVSNKSISQYLRKQSSGSRDVSKFI